jgi:LmbE family N-acetylglucosaminyl deacetylase
VLGLRLGRVGEALSILCVGAHSDDLELGCGGTLLGLLERHPGSRVTWIVCSGHGRRADEARASAAEWLVGAGSTDVRVLAFRESFFPHEGAALKSAFEDLKPCSPDLIFTHCGADKHQDHRVVSELTWNTFRNHLVLEYEIPKFDGDLGAPQLFQPIPEATVKRKCEHLRRHFVSQRDRHWFDDDLFRGLMRIRGMECQSPTRFAEAYYVRKLVLD